MKIEMIVVSATLALAAAAVATPVVRSAAGANPAAIQSAVDQFRVDLNNGGGLNAPNAGPFANGRREINWDGVPDNRSEPNLLPADFFLNTSRRGALFSTPGEGVVVSQRDAVAPPGALRFGNIDPSYSAAFQAFSQQRLFAARGSNIVDVTFFEPTNPAQQTTVFGFGAVFCDVDFDNSTSMEFFDLGGNLVHTQFVAPANNGLSFSGVFFDDGQRIGRVRLTSGSAALSPGLVDGSVDLVVMDDFFYSEPGAVPTPGAIGLAGVAMLAAGRRRRR